MTGEFIQKGSAQYMRYHRPIHRCKQLAVELNMRIAGQYMASMLKGAVSLCNYRWALCTTQRYVFETEFLGFYNCVKSYL